MNQSKQREFNKQTEQETNYMEESPIREADSSAASQQIPPHFMKPDGSLPHPHKLVACPCPGPNQYSLCPPSKFLKIHFNIRSL